MATTPGPAVERTLPPPVLVKVGNPLMRRVLTSPVHRIASGQILLLHVVGRKTGRRYDIPVGYHDMDGQLTLLTSSPWKANLRGGADVEVTLQGRRRRARATLVEDVPTVAAAYRSVIDTVGWQRAQRRLGIKVNVGRAPTPEEVEDVVRRDGLSIVRLTLVD